MTQEYWFTKLGPEKKDAFEEISQKCGLGEDRSMEVDEFIETATATVDGGGDEFFAAVYGQEQAALFRSVTKETLVFMQSVDAHLIKTMPIP
ncbi:MULTISPECIES: hypothetical protein [Rhizobium]|uniref:hypothetical protein n=1 Tax=Rhizobium TaxID=379 RepID=UPI0028B0E921|nr:hypothetical protein [Agrobacterium sp. BT-220-3]